jgi:DNA-binding transcriptional ArsR family regulator
MSRVGTVSAVETAAASAPDEVRRFVERFGLLLTGAGWPRMPARVFAFLLVDEGDGLTARDLARGLGVSPAAISGAVRYLTNLGLVERDREPGSRSDHYRIDDTVWYETFLKQSDRLRRWQDGLGDGITVVGADTRAGRRLVRFREFFAFLDGELAEVMERWRRRTAEQP